MTWLNSIAIILTVMKIAFKEEKSTEDHPSVLPISLLSYKLSRLQISKKA